MKTKKTFLLVLILNTFFSLCSSNDCKPVLVVGETSSLVFQWCLCVPHWRSVSPSIQYHLFKKEHGSPPSTPFSRPTRLRFPSPRAYPPKCYISNILMPVCVLKYAGELNHLQHLLFCLQYLFSAIMHFSPYFCYHHQILMKTQPII